MKHSYVNYDGKDAVVEYELGEHGNAIKETHVKPDDKTYSYKYDDYGNQIECKSNDYSWKKTIDSIDSFGQPTKMTEKTDSGSTYTYEIEWYGEGHVKKVTMKSKSEYSDDVVTWNYNEKGELIRTESTYKTSGYRAGTSRHHSDLTYEHDSQGRVISRTSKDEDGKITKTEYEYDKYGNVIKTVENGKKASEWEYIYVEDVSPAIAMEKNHFLGVMGF